MIENVKLHFDYTFILVVKLSHCLHSRLIPWNRIPSKLHQFKRVKGRVGYGKGIDEWWFYCFSSRRFECQDDVLNIQNSDINSSCSICVNKSSGKNYYALLTVTKYDFSNRIATRTKIIDAFRPTIMHNYFSVSNIVLEIFV